MTEVAKSVLPMEKMRMPINLSIIEFEVDHEESGQAVVEVVRSSSELSPLQRLAHRRERERRLLGVN